MIATLNKAGKINPIEASSFTNFVCSKVEINHTVNTPTKAAPTINTGEFKLPVKKNPNTIPNNTV